jgi:hypothetical protein
MAKSLILVQDSAGENVLVNIANIVRVTECDNAGLPKLIEILVREPITAFGIDLISGDELNKYYSEVSMTEFMAVCA